MTFSCQYGEIKKVAGWAALSYMHKSIKRQRCSQRGGALTGLRMALSSGQQPGSVLEPPHGSGLLFGYLLQTPVFCFSGMRVQADRYL